MRPCATVQATPRTETPRLGALTTRPLVPLVVQRDRCPRALLSPRGLCSHLSEGPHGERLPHPTHSPTPALRPCRPWLLSDRVGGGSHQSCQPGVALGSPHREGKPPGAVGVSEASSGRGPRPAPPGLPPRPRGSTPRPHAGGRGDAQSPHRGRGTRSPWPPPHRCATVRYLEAAIGRAPADPHPRGGLVRGWQRDQTFQGTRRGEVPKR